MNAKVAVDKTWFDERMADKLLRQRQLAVIVGLHPSALSLMLSGKRKMSAADAAAVARALGVGLHEVMHHAGLKPPAAPPAAPRYVEVGGWIDGEGEIHHGPPLGPQVVEAPAGFSEGGLALRIQSGGDFDGWLVFTDPAEGESVPLGQLCVVKVAPDGPMLLRTVKRGYESRVFNLSRLWGGEGSTVMPARVSWAAPVLCMQQCC